MAVDIHAKLSDDELTGYPKAQSLYDRYWEMRERYDFEALKDDHKASRKMFEELRSDRPLSAVIPERYGGDGVNSAQFCKIADVASYLSLAMGIYFGINEALFIVPILKYGSDPLQEEVLGDYLDERTVGGFMMTEPAYGTDALQIETSFQKKHGKYHLDGQKHWQGLTGWADYWVIGAREQKQGRLGRDVTMFVCPDSMVTVKERYKSLGLSLLPYGLNDISGAVDDDYRLRWDEGRGIRLLHDIFLRCRFSFPPIGAGFTRRVYREAHEYCTERTIRGNTLSSFGNVRSELQSIRAMNTLCEAMSAHYVNEYDFLDNCYQDLIKGNALKALSTDLMQDAGHRFLQLSGAMGYRTDDRAGEAYVDARGLQILEGTNDVLYHQIGNKVIDEALSEGCDRYTDYLTSTHLVEHYPESLDRHLDIKLHDEIGQRGQRIIGQITAHLIALSMAYDLYADGMDEQLLNECQEYVVREVRSWRERFQDDDPGAPSISTANWDQFT